MSDTPRQRFGALLRTLRTEHRLVQSAVGRHVHVSPDAVATWEKGRSLPDEATAQRLDALLTADGNLAAAWREADNPTGQPTARAETLSAVNVLAESAQAAADFGAWAETTNVGEVAITTLDNRVRELLQRALTEPPAAVAQDTAALNAHVFELLRGHHRPAHARGLYSTAGAACALLAWLAGDLGSIDLAQVHAATAAMCAEMSENPETAAWVAVARSKTAFWSGDYREAARLARLGALYGAPGTAAVMLACQEADACAKLGDTERTERALTAAAWAADQITEPDHLGGLWSCGPGRAANYACASHVAIGAPSRALVEADAALAAFEADGATGFGTIAQTRITKALAFTALGDIDGAAAAARPVLDLPDERRLATLRGRIAPIARTLAAPALCASAVAAPLREEIAEFCRATGRRALPAGDERREP